MCHRQFVLAALLTVLAGCGTGNDKQSSAQSTTIAKPEIKSERLPTLDNAKAYYDRGNRWYEKREYDKAIADFSEAIRLNPEYSDAYSSRGLAWDTKGNKEKAKADYKRASEILNQPKKTEKAKGASPAVLSS